MSWALIRNSDNAWLAGPLDDAPTPEEGERVIEVDLNHPARTEWSPSRGGFVDIVVVGQVCTPLAFQRRFTAVERIAVRASTDPLVIDWRELASIAAEIDLADADVVAGVNYLESQGLIGSGRAAEILAS